MSVLRLYGVWKSCFVMSLAFLFLLCCFVHSVSLIFFMNFRISLCRSMNNVIWILLGITLDLYISFCIVWPFKQYKFSLWTLAVFAFSNVSFNFLLEWLIILSTSRLNLFPGCFARNSTDFLCYSVSWRFYKAEGPLGCSPFPGVLVPPTASFWSVLGWSPPVLCAPQDEHMCSWKE